MKNSKHTATDQQIILALLDNFTQEKAAASLGICAATIRRRLDKLEFQKLYLQARRDQHSFLRARARQAVPSVLQAFAEIMGDETAKAADRFKACKSIQKHAETFELEHLQASIDEVQEHIERKENMMEEGNGLDISRLLRLKTKSERFPATARKTSATAAKINQVVFAMIQHPGNRTKAALDCHMSTETFWRWWQKPEVKATYRKELVAIDLRGNALIQQATVAAYTYMELLMKSNTTPVAVRLQSGNSILHYARAGTQMDLQERKDELDARRLILDPDVSKGLDKRFARRRFPGSLA